MTVELAPRPVRPARTATAAAPATPLPRPVRRPAPDRAPRPSQAPRTGHLRVVHAGERTRRRLTPFGGLVLSALLFLVMAGIAGAHTLIAQGQIRLDELDAQVRTEQATYQRLRQAVAAAESPERVVAAAEAQGMVTPDDLVYLQPDTASEDVAAPADAADEAGGPVSTETSWSTVKPMLEAPAP